MLGMATKASNPQDRWSGAIWSIGPPTNPKKANTRTSQHCRSRDSEVTQNLSVTVSSPLRKYAMTSDLTPLTGKGGGVEPLRHRLSGVVGWTVASLAVLAICTIVFVSSNQPSVNMFLLKSVSIPSGDRTIGRRAVYLSAAHQQLLEVAPSQRKAILQKLACDCMDVNGLQDNTWGHYTPKCCSPAKEKTSLNSVLESYIQTALKDSNSLSEALKSAKSKMDKKLSVIIDAVTQKGAGVPGPPGPMGKKGPKGYVGAPGPQVRT
jgi:hypothetical protein